MTTFDLKSQLKLLETQIPVLDTDFYSNPLLHWLAALAILTLTVCLLNMIKHAICSRLDRLAKKTETDIDDYLVSLLFHVKLLLFFSFGLSLASSILKLNPKIVDFIEVFPVLALLVQIGIWGHITIHFLLGRYVQSRESQDELLAVKTMLPPFRIVAFIFLWIILFLVALDTMHVNITAFVTGLGVGGVAIALAVQNILSDLFAAFSIVLDKPFVLGDFIIVDNLMGTVENIGLKTTRLRSLSGEQLIFSNSDLLKSRIQNYKRMYERRVVFQFGVTFESSLESIKKIPGMLREMVEAQEQTRFDRAHFAKYSNSSLDFEVVYYVLNSDFNQYMDIQQQINLGMFERFAAIGVDFAYPTRTVHMIQEGVPAATQAS